MTPFSDDFFDFIHSHANDDIDKLRLKFKYTDLTFNLDLALTQIEARKKYIGKIPYLNQNKRYIIPDNLAAQQASHQAVSSFHSSLIPEKSRVIDLTAGLGMDALSFCKKASMVFALEQNPLKAEILDYNSQLLNIRNIKILNKEAIEYLKNSNSKYDVIFVDPSRRDAMNNRVFNFSDCSPDVVMYQDLLLEKATKVVIKASPLIDISSVIKDFSNIHKIITVGVKGECKEVLVILDGNLDNKEFSPIKFNAINLDNTGGIISNFSFDFNCGSSPFPSSSFLSSPLASIKDFHGDSYILEPSAIVMKFSPWNIIAEKFKAKKLSKSSHLFISEEKPENFPGRVTKFEKFLTKKDRKSLEGFPATVISKNFPESSDSLRKTLKLKEGDNHFIYATRVNNQPIMFLSSKTITS